MRKLITAAIVGLAITGLTGCVSNEQIADPGVIQANGKFYVVSTAQPGDPWGKMKVESSQDLQHWSEEGRVFPGNTAPTWASGFWAPQIYYLNSINKYVVYYSAKYYGGVRCIGRATSNSPTNFSDPGSPWLCSPKNTDLIDPSVFFDPRTNKHWLLYKRDVPNGQGQKNIASVQLSDNGNSLIGPSYQILVPSQSWETSPGGIDGVGTVNRPSVEAPTMIYHDGNYYLFYSGNTSETDNYGVGVAICPANQGSPAGCGGANGDFRKYGGNPILTADRDSAYCGAGHQDVTPDGSIMFFHTYKSSDEYCSGPRYLAGDSLKWSGGWPSIGNGTP